MNAQRIFRRLAHRRLGAWLALAALTFSPACEAYVGPGTGLGALAALLAVIGAIFFGILGLIWYPFKRLWQRLRRKTDHDNES
jgi:hypothetical protein